MESGINHLVGLEWKKYIKYISESGRTFLNMVSYDKIIKIATFKVRLQWIGHCGHEF